MSYAEQNYTIDELTEVINGAAVGIPPANMQQFAVTVGDAKVGITALEPADTEVDGQLIASCKGFIIVMNDDHYPVDETDGTVVVDHVATGDVYTTEVTGLTNDTQYYFAAFPYTDHGVVNRAAGLRVLAGSHPNRQTATPKAYILYGFKRTKADSNPQTRVVATDMAVGLTPASMNASTGEIDLGGWANAWFVTGNNGIPWISISDMGNSGMFVFDSEEKLTREAIAKHNVKIIPQGTILLSFKLTIGRVSIATSDMCTNEAIAHFRVNDNQRSYVYCYLKNFKYDTLGNTSSISKAINSSIIKGMPFIMPKLETLVSFSEKVSPIMNEIRTKQAQNRRLAESRDRLLPKLMTGEMEI